MFSYVFLRLDNSRRILYIGYGYTDYYTQNNINTIAQNIILLLLLLVTVVVFLQTVIRFTASERLRLIRTK